MTQPARHRGVERLRVTPSLRVERGALRSGARLVAGVDEVGRGALAGPVTVGVVVVDSGTPTAPRGVRDSKVVTPRQRGRLAPAIRAWAVDHAVADATAEEIDEVGIVAAMQRAALRALIGLAAPPDVVVLDGRDDYLTPAFTQQASGFRQRTPRVVARIGADRTCSSVAAASILAKVCRDQFMTEAATRHPGYGWERNVGYGSPAHVDALRSLGPTSLHRISFCRPARLLS